MGTPRLLQWPVGSTKEPGMWADLLEPSRLAGGRWTQASEWS